MPKQENLFTRGRQLTWLNELKLPAAHQGASAKVMIALLRSIDDHARENASWRIGAARLAQCTKFSIRTVLRGLAALDNLGLIFRRPQFSAEGRLVDEIGIAWVNVGQGRDQEQTEPSQHDMLATCQHVEPTCHVVQPTCQGVTPYYRPFNRPFNRPGGSGGTGAEISEGRGAEELKLSRNDLRAENADRTLKRLIAHPEIDLTDSCEDRILFFAFLRTLFREYSQRKQTSNPIRYPAGYALSRLRRGRTIWTEGITREDRELARQSIDWIDRQPAQANHKGQEEHQESKGISL